ncbi:MAG: hypothetical protein J6Z03_00290, partial [Erysipelotrichaceae bacterium]|nr:hypothetical protein [Erysipelotrichaceae bacterium]
MEENKEFNEEEFLKKVEKAASKGASTGGVKNILLSALPTLIIIAVLAYLIVPKIEALHNGLKS